MSFQRLVIAFAVASIPLISACDSNSPDASRPADRSAEAGVTMASTPERPAVTYEFVAPFDGPCRHRPIPGPVQHDFELDTCWVMQLATGEDQDVWAGTDPEERAQGVIGLRRAALRDQCCLFDYIDWFLRTPIATGRPEILGMTWTHACFRTEGDPTVQAIDLDNESFLDADEAQAVCETLL